MKLKNLIICLVVLIVLGICATSTFAANDSINELLTVKNEDEYVEISNTNYVQTTNNTSSTNTAKLNATKNSNSPNSLTAAGLERPSIIFIVICGISAIYAYTKIKEYNNIK